MSVALVTSWEQLHKARKQTYTEASLYQVRYCLALLSLPSD